MGKIKFHLLALLITVIWGVTFISTKALLNAGLDPSVIYALRSIIAFSGLWCICLCDRRNSKNAGRLFSAGVRDEVVFVLLGVMGGSFHFWSENMALKYSQACNVAFIVCIAPLLTVLCTIVAQKILSKEFTDKLEDVSGRGLRIAGGSAIAIVGMGLVLFNKGVMELSFSGNMFALASASSWGVYSIFMPAMSEKYGILFATRKTFFYGFLTVIPFVLAEKGGITGAELCRIGEILIQPFVLGNILFLSLIASLFCFAGWNVVMSKLGNVTSSNYIYLNPFIALVTGVVILGENLTVASVIGSIAILLGVYISSLGKKARR